MVLMIFEQQVQIHACVPCRMYVYSELFRALRTWTDQTGIYRCDSVTNWNTRTKMEMINNIKYVNICRFTIHGRYTCTVYVYPVPVP